MSIKIENRQRGIELLDLLAMWGMNYQDASEVTGHMIQELVNRGPYKWKNPLYGTGKKMADHAPISADKKTVTVLHRHPGIAEQVRASGLSETRKYTPLEAQRLFRDGEERN